MLMSAGTRRRTARTRLLKMIAFLREGLVADNSNSYRGGDFRKRGVRDAGPASANAVNSGSA
jgi:hypothetical protein